MSLNNKKIIKYSLSINKIIFFCFIAFAFLINFKLGQAQEDIIKTNFATEVKETEAKLWGQINSVSPIKAYFRYSPSLKPPVFCNDIYGSNMIATKEIEILANTPTSIGLPVTGLVPGTKYYFCIVASSKTTIKYGGVESFKTQPSPLINITDTTDNNNYIATNNILTVDATTVYLNGDYQVMPIFSKAETYFLYKKTNESASQKKKVGSEQHNGGVAGSISYLLKDLSPDTSYDYEAVLKTEDLTKSGNIVTFITTSDGTIGPGTDTGTTVGTGNTTGSGTGNGTGNGTGSGNGTGNPEVGNYFIGQKVTPLSDAIVRYHEGIETVFSRQIKADTELAKIYGYQEGMDLETFSWTIADQLAKAFGYVNDNGKEIRVSKADIAAYQLYVNNGILIVYEYFDSVIVNIQKTSATLRDRYDYEYYFKK